MICGRIFNTPIAQTQKYFHAFSTQTQKYFYKKAILPAPIQLRIIKLLYLYNKCNEKLHLLSISYSLIRGAQRRGICLRFNTRYYSECLNKQLHHSYCDSAKIVLMISHKTVISNLMEDIKAFDQNAYYLISGSNEYVVFYDIHFSMIWIQTKKDIIECIHSHKYVSLVKYEGVAAIISVPKQILEIEAFKEKQERRAIVSSEKEEDDEGIKEEDNTEEENEEPEKDPFDQYMDDIEYGYLDDDD